MGNKLRQRKLWASSQKKTPIDEARDLLATTILAHVPVSILLYFFLNYLEIYF